jgi:hypothetical protein
MNVCVSFFLFFLFFHRLLPGAPHLFPSFSLFIGFFLHSMGLWSLRWAFSKFKLTPKLFLEHVESKLKGLDHTSVMFQFCRNHTICDHWSNNNTRIHSTRPPWLQAERRRQIKVISFGCPPNYFPHKHIKLQTTLNGGKIQNYDTSCFPSKISFKSLLETSKCWFKE